MRHLPTFFVILLSAATATLATLWWQNRQMRLESEAYTEAMRELIEYELEEKRYRNEYQIYQMRREIETEFLNWGKEQNQMLADTLDLIHDQVLHLLADCDKGPERLAYWRRELQSILDATMTSVRYEEKQMSPVSDDLSTAEALDREVLRMEEEVLYLLENKIGPGHCNLQRTSTEIAAVAAPVVVQGTPYKAHLFIRQTNWERIVAPDRHHYHSSMGRIQRDTLGDPRPLLVIPTEGLLAPEENRRLVTFTVFTNVKPFSEEPRGWKTQGSFWVVRE
mgnify:CR=1 FL=1